MTYDLFKFRWTILGAMMVGLGAGFAGSEFPPLLRALGAMLSAGGAAIGGFFLDRKAPTA